VKPRAGDRAALCAEADRGWKRDALGHAVDDLAGCVRWTEDDRAAALTLAEVDGRSEGANDEERRHEGEYFVRNHLERAVGDLIRDPTSGGKREGEIYGMSVSGERGGPCP
jgi:hypothetical protein